MKKTEDVKQSELVISLLFDYMALTEEAILHSISLLPQKILRHLGEIHPDNRTRKLFFTATNIAIGKESVINKHFVVSDNYLPLLKIGNRVAIGPNVTIICASYPNNSRLTNLQIVAEKFIAYKEVEICDDAWLGANVVILPGVRIGEGCIIGAGSVVTKNTEPYSVYAGVPAKFIKSLK